MKSKFSYIILILLTVLMLPPSQEVLAAPNRLDLPSKSAMILEANTGQILYAENETTRIDPASTIKILTCLLALENCNDLDEQVIVPPSALDIEYGVAALYVSPGEKLSMRDCVNALMIASANDIAITIAAHIAGSVDAFVDMMNERATELGASDSHFTNPGGLYDENNYTTAADLALIASAAWKHEAYREILVTNQYQIQPTNYEDDIRYLNVSHQMRRYLGKYYYKYCLGGKTGSSSHDGHSLVSYAEKDGLQLMTIVLGCAESGEQYTSTRTLFDYGFANFTLITSPFKDTYIGQVPIYRDESLTERIGYAKVKAATDLIYAISKDNSQKPDFIIETAFTQDLTYPVSNNQPAGYIYYYLDNVRIASIPCVIMDAQDLSVLIENVEQQLSDESILIHTLLPPFVSYIIAGFALLLFVLLLYRILLKRPTHN